MSYELKLKSTFHHFLRVKSLAQISNFQESFKNKFRGLVDILKAFLE
jgi:hypothetical protein